MGERIKVESTINAPIEKVWEMFTNPDHVTCWNHASEDWHSPKALNDLREGGVFNFRMESKDGSEGFDFTGIYDEVVPNQKISYTMSDGRRVEVVFENQGNKTQITETFDPEEENTEEVQKSGWQAILDNFKKYVEEQ